MNNKKLFEEAIAEAKSIREAAIANAKEALEESLTPQIKELLAQRLTEMEEEEEELPDAPEEKLPVLEAEEEEDEKEEEGAEEAGEKEAGEKSEEEEDMEIEDMSVEELKDLIRDIVGQMVDQDGDGDHDMEDHELEGPEMPEMGMEEPAGEEAPEDEEIDLDELLAELAMEEEEPVMEKNIDEAVFDPSTIDAIIQALETDPSLVSGEAIAKILGAGVASIFGTGFGIAGLMNLLKKGKLGKGGQELAQGLEDAASASGINKPKLPKSGFSEAINSELNEAKKTIKKLTTNLQEVNLLNAKLLYVNKVLKENKHLSDAQVANVIATFDKATTAKEAKLVYESFATTLVKKSNAPVVESKLKGLASKSAGAAPVKKVEVIAEVSDAVKRMQKLAGIIKN
jgi:hypothetical protein